MHCVILKEHINSVFHGFKNKMLLISLAVVLFTQNPTQSASSTSWANGYVTIGTSSAGCGPALPNFPTLTSLNSRFELWVCRDDIFVRDTNPPIPSTIWSSRAYMPTAIGYDLTWHRELGAAPHLGILDIRWVDSNGFSFPIGTFDFPMKNTPTPYSASFTLQDNGNLNLVVNNQQEWNSCSSGCIPPPIFASCYEDNPENLWTTYKCNNATGIAILPSPTAFGPFLLYRGTAIYSTNGLYRALFDATGSFSVEKIGVLPTTTLQSGPAPQTLWLTTTKSLSLLRHDANQGPNSVMWSSSNNNSNSTTTSDFLFLVMGDDGIFLIKDNTTGQIIWQITAGTIIYSALPENSGLSPAQKEALVITVGTTIGVTALVTATAPVVVSSVGPIVSSACFPVDPETAVEVFTDRAQKLEKRKYGHPSAYLALLVGIFGAGMHIYFACTVFFTATMTSIIVFGLDVGVFVVSGCCFAFGLRREQNKKHHDVFLFTSGVFPFPILIATSVFCFRWFSFEFHRVYSIPQTHAMRIHMYNLSVLVDMTVRSIPHVVICVVWSIFSGDVSVATFTSLVASCMQIGIPLGHFFSACWKLRGNIELALNEDRFGFEEWGLDETRIDVE
jgi:hypothetical protein